MNLKASSLLFCAPAGSHGADMVHPGLPMGWVLVTGVAMVLMAVWTLRAAPPRAGRSRCVVLNSLPILGGVVRFLHASPWPLVFLRLLAVGIFLLVIAAGLWGTPIPERNFATTFTWTLWWSLVILSVFFLGTAWCAVCPWDALAELLVKRRLWGRKWPEDTLDIKVPRALRNVWPALLLFVGLTWLELGVGVTASPLATASLALVITVLAAASLAVFERKGFCRYFCPVGRTVGFYGQLAPIELRPLQPSVCERCTTLACYHGSQQVEPCPTHLTMGRFAQNSYCTSCGACVLSCPDDNVSWWFRSTAAEARAGARPHWDEAWFMVGLLSLTLFHGATMMPFWAEWMGSVGRAIGDSGPLLTTFTLAMLLSLALPAVLYALAANWTRVLADSPLSFRRLFSTLAFSTLPLAFAGHLAHNLNHLSRESPGLSAVLANPMGTGTLPLSTMEQHWRHMNPLLPDQLLFGMQAGLLVWGFWLAMQVLRHRGQGLGSGGGNLTGQALLPMVLFAGGMNGLNLWLMAQDMGMRL